MAELDSSGLTFTTPPTRAETERFEYVNFDYIENNPGIIGNSYVSYVGIYFDAHGVRSDSQ